MSVCKMMNGTIAKMLWSAVKLLWFCEVDSGFSVSNVKAACTLCCLIADVLYIFSLWRRFINTTNLGGKWSSVFFLYREVKTKVQVFFFLSFSPN